MRSEGQSETLCLLRVGNDCTPRDVDQVLLGAAYDLNPCDDLMFAGRVDQPMAEFWTWPPYGVAYSCMEMTSAAHVYGKPIVSGEAFTATETEKWLGHPYGVKVFGDWAFCHGINRFILHRYAHQPWTTPTRWMWVSTESVGYGLGLSAT